MSKVEIAYDRIRRKFERLRTDPVNAVRGRLAATYTDISASYGRARVRITHSVRYWYLNRTPRREYELQRVHMKLDRVAQRIVRDLEEQGIAILNFRELFPRKSFAELQSAAENHLRQSVNQTQIKAIQDGSKSEKDWKYYLVRLLGDEPAFDVNEGFVDVALSDEVLGIVCRYFGMFCRLLSMDLWCNVPTQAPERYSQLWHRDPDDKKLVKMFLYLRDVDESTGPFCYVPRSHNAGIYRKIYPQNVLGTQYPPKGAVEKMFSEDQIQRCIGEAGTLILCDTTGLHRGGNPRRGLRLLYTAAFTTNAGLKGYPYSMPGLQREKLTPAARYAAEGANG